jgi:beta-lactamase regulating signal transducer with metallopeptidase domain
MSWLHYLVEANIYLGVFYLCYCLFLNNETHYLLGRAYLLFSCVVSFILPVTQLSVLKPVEQLTLQPVVYMQPVNYAPLPQITIVEPEKHITINDVLLYAYIAGAVITLSVLFYRLYRLSLLTRKSKALYGNKYKLIQLNGDNTAFSFFNYLFIGTEVPQADTIIAHELVHIRQKHSADIIFVEFIKVLSWFSPFIYLLQRSLRTIHEYIADEQTAAQECDALSYSSFLLNNAYGLQGSPIAQSFFNYNLLKKRIIMLNQKRSGSLARLKYLAAVPLCMGMLCASTLVFSKDYAFIDLAPKTKPVENLPALKAAKTAETTQADTNKRKLPPPPPPLPAKHKKAPKLTYDISGKKLPPPPPVAVPNAPRTPPAISKEAPAPPMVVPAKPAKPAKAVKTLKAKALATPEPAVAPVIKADISNVNVVLDSPIVVTNVKLNLKEMQNIKAVSNIKLSKLKTDIKLKLSPVVIDNVKPIKVDLVPVKVDLKPIEPEIKPY